MNHPDETRASMPQWERYAWILGVTWTVINVALLALNVAQESKRSLEAGRIQARAAHEKDIVYRRWNTEHGGVYVPVTEATEPNPYLSDLPERDVILPSGKLLTLVNPAYMTRQVHELGADAYGGLGHITSMNPIRPENGPDPWELEALKAFERGEIEVSSIQDMKGGEYMRLMRPLMTEKGCLKCHAKQGYKEGDIRGGISVSIPMMTMRASERRHLLTTSVGYAILWLAGMGGIILGTQRLRRVEGKRARADERIKAALAEKELLLKETHHRVKNNLAVIQSLLRLQSTKIEDESSKAYFNESRDRVQAMSMIHDRLSKKEDFKHINVSEYLHSLASQLFQSYSIDPSRVMLTVEVPEIKLDVNTVIPCGLIVNELISNALKYAFQDSRDGELFVRLSEENDKQYTLVVRDSGAGFPEDIDIYNTRSMGMLIVTGLTKQLDGRLELISDHGTEFRITFKEKPIH